MGQEDGPARHRDRFPLSAQPDVVAHVTGRPRFVFYLKIEVSLNLKIQICGRKHGGHSLNDVASPRESTVEQPPL